MNSKPNQLYIFTINSMIFQFDFQHIITSREEIIDKLLWNKQNVPELWQDIPQIEVLQYYSTSELAEKLYHGKCICMTELSDIDVNNILNKYKKGKKKNGK